MNISLVKFGLLVFAGLLIMFIVLKPIVYNEDKYKVVIVNASEHPITSATITGVGQNSGKIGPILVGKINDFIFIPEEDGVLEYSIKQNDRELTGVVNGALKKNDVGEIYVVVGEMYKVRIKENYDI